jgi:hypothetical protein
MNPIKWVRAKRKLAWSIDFFINIVFFWVIFIWNGAISVIDAFKQLLKIYPGKNLPIKPAKPEPSNETGHTYIMKSKVEDETVE